MYMYMYLQKLMNYYPIPSKMICKLPPCWTYTYMYMYMYMYFFFIYLVQTFIGYLCE